MYITLEIFLFVLDEQFNELVTLCGSRLAAIHYIEAHLSDDSIMENILQAARDLKEGEE